MRSLIVNEKTGFEIVDPNQTVVIRDARHILFYTNEPIKPRATCFNLPAFGQYWIDSGSIRKLASPVNYPMAELPLLIPRFNITPYNFKIVWGNNPSKCTILWEKRIIFADSKLKESPLPQMFFILEHEYAHLYTKDDALADQIAGNYMKELGFNPVQIGESSIFALSDRQIQRKATLVNSLIASK